MIKFEPRIGWQFVIIRCGPFHRRGRILVVTMKMDVQSVLRMHVVTYMAFQKAKRAMSIAIMELPEPKVGLVPRVIPNGATHGSLAPPLWIVEVTFER